MLTNGFRDGVHQLVRIFEFSREFANFRQQSKPVFCLFAFSEIRITGNYLPYRPLLVK